ncbi:hypothetical protein AB4072_09050 [Microvirga sp. 2MCAF38]|uniref:hypothetical protein n=1 Tax=Microvirga sp. 2MCAF38 TaxID=3232989 RepID=UPI003F9ADCF5
MTVIFEQSGDIGGRWNSDTAHSVVWPELRANTSRTTTQFSNLNHATGTLTCPRAAGVKAYLKRYVDVQLRPRARSILES